MHDHSAARRTFRRLAVLLGLASVVAGALAAAQQARRRNPANPRPAQPARRAQRGGPADRTQQPPVEPPTGPMRVEPLTLIEVRIWDPAPELNRPFRSSLRLQVKITGQRLGQLVRAGKLILEEMRTDTDEQLELITPYKERDYTATQNVYITDRTLRQGFLPREVTVQAPSRKATRITTCRGYINLAYASATREIEIRDPLSYQGRVLDAPELKELGIVVRVLKLGQETEEPDNGRGIALRFEKGKDLLRAVNFYDGWFRRVPARGQRHEAKEDGRPGYTHYAIQRGRIDHDTFLVLTVFSDLTSQKLEFDLKDMPLP